MVVEWILILRLYALYDQSQKLLYGISGLWVITTIASNAVLFTVAATARGKCALVEPLSHLTLPLGTSEPIQGLKVCFVTSEKPYLYAYLYACYSYSVSIVIHYITASQFSSLN